MKRQGIAAILCIGALMLAGCADATPTGTTDATVSEKEQQERNARGYRLYQDASENLASQACLDLTVEGTVALQTDDGKRDMTLAVELQLGGDPTAPQLYKHFTLTESGNTTEYTQYYLEGKRYYADAHQQYYEAFTPEKANTLARQYFPFDLTETAFEKVSLVETEAETQVVLSLDGERVEDQVLAADGWFSALFPNAVTEDSDAKVTDASLSISVNNDGYYTAFTKFYVVETEDATYRVRLASTVNRVAQAVTITFPDFSDYQSKTDSKSNTLDEDTLAVLPEVMERLYDEDGKPVTDYDARYLALCKKYTEKQIETAAAWYENFLRTQEIGAAD